MSRERSERASAIAQSAIHKDPSERSRYVREACSDDPSLISEIESVLAVYDRTGSLPGEYAFDVSEEDLDAVPSMEAELDDVVGRKIGKYEIVARIGSGSMGVVYKARDPFMDRFVGIKTMPPGGSSFPHVRKRFYREARSAGKLSHKNIITVHDLGEYKGRPFIAMEFLVGEDLKSRLDRGDWPNLEQQLRWMIETCEGLDHAHKKQVIHRDIKPGNIFITQEGQVKILDFGLARLATSVGTKSGLVVGTPSYMAPEQVRGEKADRRSDIYSAAAMFYELLTHQKPCISESLHGLFYKILEVDPDPVEKLNPLLPKEISPIISRAMAKNPEERFDTAGELVRELMAIEGSLRSQKLDLRADVRGLIHQLEAKVDEYLELGREQDVNDPVGREGAERLLADWGVADTEDDTTIQLETAIDYLTLVETLERAIRELANITECIEKLGDAKELYLKAEAAEQEGTPEEAQRLTRLALELAPEHGAAKELLARVDAELKRRADEAANKQTKISRLLKEAERLREATELESSRSRVIEILELDPAHSRAQELQRDILAELERQRKRQEASQRAEELLASAESQLQNEDDPETCLDLLEQVATLVPEHPRMANLEERASQRLQEKRDSEQKRKRAIEHLGSASSALQDGQLAKARRELDRAQSEYSELSGIAELNRELENAEHEQIERQQSLRKVKELLREVERRIEVGEDEAVLGSLEEILTLDPTHPQAALLKKNIEASLAQKRRQARETLAQARKARRAGDLEKAISLCGSVLLDFPGHEDAKILLTRSDAELRTRREQERREEKVKEITTCANDMAARGDIEATITLLEGVGPTLADHPALKDTLARHRQAQREQEAEARRTKRFEEKAKMARVLLLEEDFEASERAAVEALRIRPEDADVMSLRDEARARAQEQRDQRLLEAKLGRILDKARSLRDRGKDKAALKRARAALALSPTNEVALGIETEVLQRIEETAQRKKLDRLLKASHSAVKRGRDSEALEHVQGILDLDPSHREAIGIKTEILHRRQEKSRQARATAHELIEQARRAEKSGQPRKALALGRSALLADDTNKEAIELVNRLKTLTGLDETLRELEFADTDPTAETVVNVGTLEALPSSWWRGRNLAIGTVVALVAIVAAVITAYVVRNTPPEAPPDIAMVWVDVSPWAEITSIQETTAGHTVEISNAFTPCLLDLPAGTYKLEFTNHISPNEPIVAEFDLSAGEMMIVNGTLPAFEIDQAGLSLDVDDSPPTDAALPQEEFEQNLSETARLITEGRIREAESRLADMELGLPRYRNADEMRLQIDELCMAMDERTATADSHLQEGWEALADRSFDQARARFEKAIEVDLAREELKEKLSQHDQGVTRALLREAFEEVRFSLRQGKEVDAQPSLELARLVQPEDPQIGRILEERLMLENAWRLYQQGDYEQAKSEFQEVLARDPENLHALQQVRRIEETELDPRLERSFEDLIRLAREATERQEIGVADSSLRDARALIPDDPALVKALEELQGTADGKAQEAIRRLFVHRQDEAIQDLEDCLAVLADSSELHLHLGWAYYVEYLKGGKKESAIVEKAEEQLREALRLEPDLKTDPQTASPHFVQLLENIRKESTSPTQQ